MIRITVYSGPARDDMRPSSCTMRITEETEVHEELRKIGLEYKNADYMPQRQVVITLDPVAVTAEDADPLKVVLKGAVDKIEEFLAR